MVPGADAATDGKRWHIFSRHGLALLHLAERPQSGAREIAEFIGVSQRQAQRLLADLARDGYIHHHREGNNHHYQVDEDQPLRHPHLAQLPLGTLIKTVLQRD